MCLLPAPNFADSGHDSDSSKPKLFSHATLRTLNRNIENPVPFLVANS
jgi:hypothetical protein